MNKSNLIKILSQKTEFNLKKTEELIDLFFDTITNSLQNKERVELRNFGVFKTKKYEGYLGKNPKTGERINVLPKCLPTFKTGLELRERSGCM